LRASELAEPRIKCRHQAALYGDLTYADPSAKRVRTIPGRGEAETVRIVAAKASAAAREEKATLSAREKLVT